MTIHSLPVFSTLQDFFNTLKKKVSGFEIFPGSSCLLWKFTHEP